MAKQFDQNENVIRVPPDPDDPACVRGIRVPLTRCVIGIKHADQPDGNDEDYTPVAAVRVCGRKGNTDARVPSNGYRYENACGISRVSFWLTGLVKNRDAVPNIEFEIRGSCDCINEIFVWGTIVPQSWSDSGMVVQVQGPLVTQWEFWARVVGDDPQETNAVLQAMVDRGPSDGRLHVIRGAIVPNPVVLAVSQ